MSLLIMQLIAAQSEMMQIYCTFKRRKITKINSDFHTSITVSLKSLNMRYDIIRVAI